MQNIFMCFFAIKCTDILSGSSFKRISQFLIMKTYQSNLREGYSHKKLQSGDLLVEVSIVKQSQLISNCSTTGSFAVSVQVHQILKTSHGVISESEFC